MAEVLLDENYHSIKNYSNVKSLIKKSLFELNELINEQIFSLLCRPEEAKNLLVN